MLFHRENTAFLAVVCGSLLIGCAIGLWFARNKNAPMIRQTETYDWIVTTPDKIGDLPPPIVYSYDAGPKLEIIEDDWLDWLREFNTDLYQRVRQRQWEYSQHD